MKTLVKVVRVIKEAPGKPTRTETLVWHLHQDGTCTRNGKAFPVPAEAVSPGVTSFRLPGLSTPVVVTWETVPDLPPQEQAQRILAAMAEPFGGPGRPSTLN